MSLNRVGINYVCVLQKDPHCAAVTAFLPFLWYEVTVPTNTIFRLVFDLCSFGTQR